MFVVAGMGATEKPVYVFRAMFSCLMASILALVNWRTSHHNSLLLRIWTYFVVLDFN